MRQSKGLGLLIVASLLAFLPLCIDGNFIWDDPKLVLLNNWTGSLFSNLGNMFTQDLWASTPLGAGEFFYYRPLMLVSLSIDQFFGFGPAGHHLHSLLWHLLCVSLLYRLAREAGASGVALVAGVSLFALHPLQTEVLAHIAARNDAMATAGLLGALLLLLPQRPSNGALWGAAGLMTLAVFSKETAYLAPLLLWSLDRARFQQAENLKRYAAILLPLGLALGLRLSLGGGELPRPDNWSDSLWILFEGTAFYLGALVFPWEITPTVSTSEMSLIWPLSVSGAILIAILARISGAWGRWGLLLALIGFLPALPGLLLTDNTGFRYLYLPMAGLALAAACALQRVSSKMLLVLPAFWFTSTALQLPNWSNDRTLWTHAYDVAPGLQSSCGLFKTLETKARALPLGAERDALFIEAEPWLARALEPPTSPYCCLSASRWMWERNQNEWMLTRPEPAIQWGNLALQNGCSPSAELMVPLAASKSLVGDWDQAERLLAGLTRDPFGLRDVIYAAAGLRSDDRSRLETIAGPDPAQQSALEQRALMLLSASEANIALREE